MSYELWDVETANCVGFYDDLEKAHADILWAIKEYGPESPEVVSLALAETEGRTEIAWSVAGAELVEWALEVERLKGSPR